MTKQRGGQPGNQNALKHGFYSKTFMLGDLTDNDPEDKGIDGEILIAKIITKRLMGLYKHAETLDKQISLLIAAGNAASHVVSMKRVQNIIHGDHNMLDVIRQAIEEVNDELDEENRKNKKE